MSPDHRLVTVAIDGITDPDGDPISIEINAVTQDEPTNGLSDGDNCPDVFGIGGATVDIRAERSGTGNGRVYTTYFNASDGRGGATQGSVTVAVPHNSDRVAINDGSAFNSTTCR